METIESLNQRLIDYFGIDTSSGQPMFRIVWANDETEHRLVDRLDTGIALLYATVMEVKKYPYLKDLYVLERLVAVPEINQNELPGLKLSYEPLWAYRGPDGHPIAPVWIPTKFVIDTLYAALGKKSMAKYVEKTSEEDRQRRIDEIAEELFGNETETGDAMAYGEAIVVPRSYKEEN